MTIYTDEPMATLFDVAAATPAARVRTTDTLLRQLDVIDVEGWEGPTGTALLRYVRNTIVRPLVVELGVRGAAASQAEASAWQEVWVEMTLPRLRTAAHPWAALWQTSRHAVLTEIVAARYGTNGRRAWRLEAERRAGEVQPMLVVDDGEDFEQSPCASPPREAYDESVISVACTALASVGWLPDEAARVVQDVLTDEPDSRSRRWTARTDGWTTYGWRAMADRLSLPPWQARRLVLVLRGTAARPGLLPRLILGETVRLDATWRIALASTRSRRSPAPQLPAWADADHPQQLAG